MIRYRCPHCTVLTLAHERRVGQSSVCKVCLKSHPIPSDTALWLTETGELLHAPVAPAAPAATAPEIELPAVNAPEPVVSAPVDVSPTPPDIHLSEPIVASPAPALVTQEPEPLPAPPVLVAKEPEPVVSHEPEPVLAPPTLIPREPEPVAPRVPRFTVRQPREATVAFAESAPESGGVATQTPPPQPTRTPVPTRDTRPARLPVPAAPRNARTDTPRPTAEPTYAEPLQLQTQADIAVALTAAITNRMKPAAAPRRDLRPSTAVWMLLTGIGVAFLLVALFAELNYRMAAIGIGIAQVAIGYAWIVWLTHRRDPRRGLACAIPPATFFYLAQRKYAKFRPLRFVLTGAALAGLGAVAPLLADFARPLVAKPAAPTPLPDPASESKLAQLRTYRDQRAYDSLLQLLALLVKTDSLKSVDAPDRAELAAELKSLCSHPLTEVRIAAMTAFQSWDPTPNQADARSVCLTAIKSPTHEERMCALLLLPRWKDADTARAVQSLIGAAGSETNRAKASLLEIGGPPAEEAALSLLKRADANDQTTRTTAIDILEQVGGVKAAEALRIQAQSTEHLAVRTRALNAVVVIEARLRKTGP